MIDSNQLVRIERGNHAESIHRGHIAVVNSAGEHIASLGNPAFMTFARSTAKLLQAIPVIESGAAEAYSLSDEEIAILCASHNGEQQHVATVLSILHKAGISPEAMQCGAHEPFHQPTASMMRTNHEAPTSLHNNCSGKHSGMLILSAYMNVMYDNYTSLTHPVQQTALSVICDLCGLKTEEIALGIDGCGVPVFGLPIDRLAQGYSRFGNPGDLSSARAEACRRILECLRQHPYYLAGTDRFDTRLIEITQGRIIGKMGAEGIYAMTIPEEGLGIVVKVEDGSFRALYPAIVEVLKQLRMLRPSELSKFERDHTPTIRNWRGDTVGRVIPSFTLL